MKFTLPAHEPFNFLSVVNSHGWRSALSPVRLISKLVSHGWYRGKPITAREVEKRFEKWGEFKGIAFWFWDWKDNG